MKVSTHHQRTTLFLELDGAMDAGLQELLPSSVPPQVSRINITLMRLRNMNSIGVREWVTWLQDVSAKMPVEIVDAPIHYLAYCNMVPSMKEAARVRSVVVPIVCTACGQEGSESLAVEVLAENRSFDDLACDACGKGMSLDGGAAEELDLFLQGP